MTRQVHLLAIPQIPDSQDLRRMSRLVNGRKMSKGEPARHTVVRCTGPANIHRGTGIAAKG